MQELQCHKLSLSFSQTSFIEKINQFLIIINSLQHIALRNSSQTRSLLYYPFLWISLLSYFKHNPSNIKPLLVILLLFEGFLEWICWNIKAFSLPYARWFLEAQTDSQTPQRWSSVCCYYLISTISDYPTEPLC